MRNTEPTPGVLATLSSPPIRSVSILAMVRPRPAPGAAWLPAVAPRAKGSKICSSSSACQAGAGVLDLDVRHLARMADAEGDLALRRELDGVAQQVDQDLAHPLLVGAHDLGQGALRLEAEGQPLAGRLQLEHARHFVHAVGEAAWA